MVNKGTLNVWHDYDWWERNEEDWFNVVNDFNLSAVLLTDNWTKIREQKEQSVWGES